MSDELNSRRALNPHGARVDLLAEELLRNGIGRPSVAVILGSGLGAFAEGLGARADIEGAELEHLPASGVPGHAGRISTGTLGGVSVLVQMGRVHLYEGWSPFEVTRSIRAYRKLGVRTLLLTNAAGGLHRELSPSSFVAIEDHINLQFRAPLFAGEEAIGSPYDLGILDAFERVAAGAGIALVRGIYAGVSGPSYETPAEIRALKKMGASAVGMSTVCEATAAARIGMRVGAVSCISNPAAGVGVGALEHSEVVEVGRVASGELLSLLAGVIRELETDETDSAEMR